MKNLSEKHFPPHGTTYDKELRIPKAAHLAILGSTKPGRSRDNCIKFVWAIHKNNYRRHELLPDREWVALPSTYLEKVVGKSYHKYKKILVEAGIIEDNRSWSSTYRVCMKYRIRPAFSLGDEVLAPVGEERPALLVELGTDWVIQNGLELDVEAATAFTKTYVDTKAYMDKIKVGAKVNTEARALPTRFGDSGRKMCSLSKAREVAQERGMEIFQDGKKLDVEFYERYVARKGEEVLKAWTQSISGLFSGKAKVGTNGRLFSTVSTIPGSLMRFLTIDGQNCNQIDLKNSQPSFFNIEMRGEGDRRRGERERRWREEQVRRGICPYPGDFEENSPVPDDEKSFFEIAELAANGTLYDFIKDGCGFETRTDAKVATLRMLYSSHRTNCRVKEFFKAAFPGVAEFIDSKKKNESKAYLANLMQSKESDCFIKRILHELYVNGFKVLSKHDSIICKESDTAAVKEIMDKVLTEVLGKYSLEIKAL